MSVPAQRTRQFGTVSAIAIVIALFLPGCGGSDSAPNANNGSTAVQGVTVPSQISVVTPTE